MPGKIASFLENNPTLSIGGGIVVVLIIAGIMSRQKKTLTATTGTGNAPATQDLTGLSNGLVYIPTQTTFDTYNDQSGSSNYGNTTTTQTTTTQTATGGGIIGFPVSKIPGPQKHPVIPPVSHKPPVKIPPPNTKGKGLIWDQRYTIRGGETLSGISAQLTTRLRAAGMPGSMSLTYHDLYAHNTSVINATSSAHHNPIPGGPWNDIFPGETIIVPRWG